MFSMSTIREMRAAQSDALAFVLALALAVGAILAGAGGRLEGAMRALREPVSGAAAAVPQTLALLLVAMLLGAAISSRGRAARIPLESALTVFMLGAAMTALAVALDRSSAVYLPLGEAALFLGLFLALRLALALKALWQDQRTFDRATGLPTARALSRALRSSLSARVAAARIPDLVTPSAVLSLAEIAQLTKEAARRLSIVSDIEEVHLIAPGIFGWIMHPQAGDDSDTTFEAARALFNSPFNVGGQRIALVPHFGRAPGSISGAVAAAGLAADRSLVWSCVTSAVLDERVYRERLLGEFDAALASGAITVLFQPRVDLASGRIAGAECLARWISPTIGGIAPADFVPMLEALGRLADLTRFVARTAAARALEAHAQGHSLVFAVKIAPSLLLDRAFVSDMRAILDGLPLGLLGFEIAPGSAADREAHAALELFASSGAQLFLDAIPTTPEPPALSFAQVKLDHALARALSEGEDHRSRFRASVAKAHESGVKVVAQGAETRPILEAMKACGANFAQGWEVGKPMRWEDLAFALERQRPAKCGLVEAAA